jgi:hypothetical protein
LNLTNIRKEAVGSKTKITYTAALFAAQPRIHPPSRAAPREIPR